MQQRKESTGQQVRFVSVKAERPYCTSCYHARGVVGGRVSQPEGSTRQRVSWWGGPPWGHAHDSIRPSQHTVALGLKNIGVERERGLLWILIAFKFGVACWRRTRDGLASGWFFYRLPKFTVFTGQSTCGSHLIRTWIPHIPGLFKSCENHMKISRDWSACWLHVFLEHLFLLRIVSLIKQEAYPIILVCFLDGERFQYFAFLQSWVLQRDGTGFDEDKRK